MTGLGDGAVLRLVAGGAALSDEEVAALVAAVDTVLAGGRENGPATPIPAVDGWRRAARLEGLEGLGARRVADLADLRTHRP